MTEHAEAVVLNVIEDMHPITTGRIVDEAGFDPMITRAALRKLRERGEIVKRNSNTYDIPKDDYEPHWCPSCGTNVSVDEDRRCVECNTWLDPYVLRVQEKTHEWRMEKWPNLTPLVQLAGTDVEVSELLEMEVKSYAYDEEWMTQDRLEEEIGDTMIYLMGYASLYDLDIVDCIESALEKNDQRDWDAHQEAP